MSRAHGYDNVAPAGSFATSVAVRLWTLIGLVGLAGLMVRPQVDPDAWWHVLVGEWIVANRALPREDLVSWWAAGTAWISPSWLNEVLLWMADQLAGAVGQSLLYLPVYVAIALLMERCMAIVHPALRGWHRLALLTLGVISMLVVLSPRAANWDLLFALFAVYGWLRWRADGATLALWLMPLAAIAWANLHGSGVMLYLALLLAFLVGSWIDRRRVPQRAWRPVWLSAALTLVAVSVNGYGLELYLYPWSTLLSPAQTVTIAEWVSPDLAAPVFLPLRAILAVGLVVGLARAGQRDAFGALAVGGLLFLALGGARYLLLAMPLLTIWYLPPVVGGLGRYLSVMPVSRRVLTHRYASTALPSAALAVVLTIVGGAALVNAVIGQETALAARYPADNLAVADQCPGRLWTDYGWGGWVAYQLRRPTGPYGAADSLGDERVLIAAQVEGLRVDPAGVFDTVDVEHVLTASDGPLAHWLEASPDWTVVGTDRVSSLAVRRAGQCDPRSTAD